MPPQQHIYAILRGPEDWASVEANEPRLWSYDRNGALAVEPSVFAARAAPHVWTESGWDSPPRTYPALAIRELLPEPPAPAPSEEEPPAPRPVRRPTRLPMTRLTVKVPAELAEQVSCLCEVYRLTPAEVVTRLVSDAYRRDVVDTGALAILGDDFGIIAPR